MRSRTSLPPPASLVLTGITQPAALVQRKWDSSDCHPPAWQHGGMTRAYAVVATTDQVLKDLAATVDPEEAVDADALARMNGLRREDARQSFLAVRIAATWLLRAVTEEPAATIRQRCPVCDATDHGRPVVIGAPGWEISWSRRPGVIAVALAAGSGPDQIGIDVEDRTAEIPAGVGTGNPREDLLGWTRAEALVKVGATDLGAILEHLPSGPATRAGLRWPGFEEWLLVDRLGPTWIASVASVSPVTWVDVPCRRTMPE